MAVWRVAVFRWRPVPRVQLIQVSVRNLFSESGVWERDYRADTRRRVEQCWTGHIQEQWQRDVADQVNPVMVYSDDVQEMILIWKDAQSNS